MNNCSTQAARVKFPAGRIFQTQYGARINAVLILDDGKEIKLWSSPGDEDLESLWKGQEVTLVQVNGKWKLNTHQPAQQQNSFGAVQKLEEMLAAIVGQLNRIETKLDSQQGGQ